MSFPPPNPLKSPDPSLPVIHSLYKHKSWSPDFHRDEAWERRRERQRHHRRSKSVTDDDIEEFMACVELGFGFDSPEMDQRLSYTVPAYGVDHAVNKQCNNAAPKPPLPISPSRSECQTPSPLGSPLTVFAPGDEAQAVKARLKQWAQVVACSVRQTPI